MENQKILDILRDSGSLLEGHFLLTSGKHSDRYCQCAKLLQYPDHAKTVVEEMLPAAKELNPTVVVGPAMGGIVIGYELARQLGVRSIFTERDKDGNMSLRRGFELSPEDRVIIAEDVVTTAKSSMETAAVIEQFGATVVGLGCLVDRRIPGATVPFPLFSATTLQVQTFDAEECALCKDGVELVQPGSRKKF